MMKYVHAHFISIRIEKSEMVGQIASPVYFYPRNPFNVSCCENSVQSHSLLRRCCRRCKLYRQKLAQCSLLFPEGRVAAREPVWDMTNFNHKKQANHKV